MSSEHIPFAQPAIQTSEVSETADIQPSLVTFQTEGLTPATPFDAIKELEKIQASDDGLGAAVWYNNKKVLELWTKAENRNGWLRLTDLGWKKIFNGSDTSVVAIALLGGQALEKQSLVNVLIENDQIIEIYVW